MCGIVGVAGAINQKQELILKQLLIVDSLRGTDSTGIATVNKGNGTVKVAKQLGDPYNLFSDKRFDSAMGGVHKAIIGHNRWATVGGVTRASAHPFEFDTLVGVHNGTLTNKHALKDQLHFKVDSENLFYQIEEDGLHDTMKIVRGAWTLVWWDKISHTMNFLRNKERPLSMVVSKDGKGLYWASEAWMLNGVLGREQVEHEGLWQLPEDQHLSFHINDKGEIAKPVIVECKGAPLFTNPIQDKGQTSETRLTVVVTPTGIKQPDGSVITYLDPRKNPDSKTYADYNKNLDNAYKNKKSIRFETLAKARDVAGGDYVMLFDPKAPEKEVRLYLHSHHDVENHIGEDIIADVTIFCGNKDGGYYKANPWSVLSMSQVDAKDLEDVTIEDLIVRKEFKSRNGIKLSRADWLGLYAKCDCCDCDMIPEQNNRFTVVGQIMCQSCAENEEFAQYVNFVD